MTDWRIPAGEQLERLLKLQALEFADAWITQCLRRMSALEERMTAIGHRDQLRKMRSELEDQAPSRQEFDRDEE